MIGTRGIYSRRSTKWNLSPTHKIVNEGRSRVRLVCHAAALANAAAAEAIVAQYMGKYRHCTGRRAEGTQVPTGTVILEHRKEPRK